MLPYDFNRATKLTNSGVRSPRPPVYCNHYGIYVEPFDKLYHVGWELPEGQEKVPWGMTPSRRFSSNYTNFINLYPSTAAFIFHFPLSILNSPLT